MRLWTSATLGVAAVVACAGGAAAQTPGCASCNGGAALKPGVPNTIPHCSKHNGLTQYPLSEKRYIKQFCNPTICPNSCFGHFKTQWTAWPQACPGWPQEGVDAANYGPNFARYESPAATAANGVTAPAAPAPVAPSTPLPAPTPADATNPPSAPPSKPLELPPSKPAVPKADAPTIPMPVVPMPPAGKLPDLPPAGGPGGRF